VVLDIKEELSGKSVLEVLKQHLGFSGSMLRHVKFMKNGITVNGTQVTVRYVLREGDRLALQTEDRAEEQKVEPVDLPLTILYEDNFVVVPDKPPHMPTHPSCDHYRDTVANALAYRYAPDPYVFRPVNRLDRNTSGLVLIARNRIAAAKLAQAMREHRIHKEYLAILDGVLPQDSGRIETHLCRTADSIILRRVCTAEEGGDYALTQYRVLLRSDSHTLVLARPITGRTHQLRVHFAHLGCPITGDDLYGNATSRIDRHALHAVSLSFPHPDTQKEITLYAPLHADMEQLFQILFPGKDFPYEIFTQNRNGEGSL